MKDVITYAGPELVLTMLAIKASVRIRLYSENAYFRVKDALLYSNCYKPRLFDKDY